MKIIKLSFIVLGILSLISCVETDNNPYPCDKPCEVCQRTVYQLKYDRFADCGNNICKNTCHKVLNAWYSPLKPFEDFHKDILGKCDICFRNGYCSISDCETLKNHERKLINQIVEKSNFRGRASKHHIGARTEIIDHHGEIIDHHHEQMIEESIDRSIDKSVRSGSAKRVSIKLSKVFGNDLNDASKSGTSSRYVQKLDIYKKFIDHTNHTKQKIEKLIEKLKDLMENYVKIKDYKTVSPEASAERNKIERTENIKKKLNHLCSGILHHLEHKIAKLNNVLHTIANHHQRATKFKQDFLSGKIQLNPKQKKIVENLARDINLLVDFQHSLNEVLQHLNRSHDVVRVLRTRID